MAEDQCGATSDGLVCDRPEGHTGSHRGYNQQIDEAMFWGRSEPEQEKRDRLIDRIVDRLKAGTGRAHIPGDNGMVVTPDEIRDALQEELP